MHVALARFLLFVLLCAWSSLAEAQSGSTMLEPERMALIIGNSNYTDDGGTLTDLGGACADAEAIRAVLVDEDRWTSVNKVCDLTVNEMQAEISQFIHKLKSTRRAFGIIYFSGHGAQIGGRNYLFGTDAKPDYDVEAQIYLEHTQDGRPPSLFETDAIDIDREIARVNSLPRKALVVVLDACRSNVLEEEFARRNILITMPREVSDINGVVWAFATKNGRSAPGASMGAVGRYAAALVELMKSESDATASIELLLSRHATTVSRESNGRQNPDKSGYLNRPPEFCLRGCPSRQDAWEPPTRGSSNGSPVVNLGARMLPAETRMIHPASWQVDPGEAAQLMPAPPAQPERTPEMHVAIHWCDGDASSDTRRRQAENLETIVELLRGRPPVAGYVLGEIDIFPLTPSDNTLPRYRMQADKISVNAENSAERAWAEAIIAGEMNTATVLVSKNVTPDAISIFVCAGYDLRKSSPAIVYMQVADASDEPEARTYAEGIEAGLNGVNVVRDVETRDVGLNTNEVRYFLEQDQALAGRVADSIAATSGIRPEVKRIEGYEQNMTGSPILEVWLASSKGQ